MKKIIFACLVSGLAAPLMVFAQTDTTAVAPVTKTAPVAVAYDGKCASGAVIAHENSQMAIVDAREATMRTATIARRDSLGAAYLLSDKTARDAAIKAAHDAFLSTQKTADKTAGDSSKKENDSFLGAMNGCGAKLPPPTRDQMDNQGRSDGNVEQGAGQNVGKEKQQPPLPPQGQQGKPEGKPLPPPQGQNNKGGGPGFVPGQKPQDMQGGQPGQPQGGFDPRQNPGRPEGNQGGGQGGGGQFLPPPPMGGQPGGGQFPPLPPMKGQPGAVLDASQSEAQQLPPPPQVNKPWWRFW